MCYKQEPSEFYASWILCPRVKSNDRSERVNYSRIMRVGKESEAENVLNSRNEICVVCNKSVFARQSQNEIFYLKLDHA